MKKLIVFSSPLLLCIEVIILNFILEMMSMPSDVAVFSGIICFCLFGFANFLLLNFIIKQFKKNQEK